MGNTCCASPDAKCSVSTQEFLKMLRVKPSLIKFGFPSDNLKTLTKAGLSPVFGGNVLSPIGGVKLGKSNSLESNIKQMDKQMDVMQGGGYYILQNIREQPDTRECVDIYLLTEQIQNKELLHKIKTIHEITQQQNSSIKSITSNKTVLKTKDQERRSSITGAKQTCVYFDEVAEGITGYARIVRYTNHSINTIIAQEDVKASGQHLIKTDPSNLEIQAVEEGQFVKGKKDGYNRVLTAQDGSCEVGFFKEDVPWGKYCKYNLKGDQILSEGLYEGHGAANLKTKIKIHNYQSQISKTDRKWGDDTTTRRVNLEEGDRRGKLSRV